jgi:hypothetical protein
VLVRLIFGPWRPERAVAPASRTAASRPRSARTPRQASDPWSMRRRRPCRTAILVLSPCATRPRTPRRPANCDVAVRALRGPCTAIGRRASPPPHGAHVADGRDPLLKARTPTKGLNSPLRALPRAPSRHCRRQRRRAPPSDRLYRQCVLLRPALVPLVATPLAYCSDRAVSSRNPGSRGRRRAASTELVPPPALQANGPS